MILHRLNFAPDRQAARFTDYLRDDATMDAHLADMFEAMVDRLGTERPTLKAPELCHLVGLLHRFFRRPIRTICLVRDPRDVIASVMQVAERQGKERDLVAAADYIGAFYESISVAAANPHPNNPVLLVKYEHFVSQQTDWQGLEEFVGYPLPEYHGIADEALAPGNAWHSNLYAKPITPERVGSYKGYLTPDEIGAIDESYARFYERFGYSRHSEDDLAATSTLRAA